jgi:Nucleoside diphosphate kinase
MASPAHEGLPAWLTSNRRKLALYPDDIYFREAWADLQSHGTDVLVPLLTQTTFILFKAEAIVGRRVEIGLRFLRAHGFEALDARALRFDRHLVRAFWRYQLNAAPLATLQVVDMIAASAEFLLVTLRHTGASAEASAAVRLSTCKGSSRSADRRRGQLRDLMVSPTLLLNFVHAPDEPADLVRELGVLLGAMERREVLAALSATEQDRRDAARALESLLEALYARNPAHHLELSMSRSSLQLAASHAPAHAAMAAEVLDARADLADPAALQRMVDWLDTADIDLPRWDRLVIGAHLVGSQPPERRPLVESGPSSAL